MNAPAHPLDNPIWSALTTHQHALGTDGPLARRFNDDIGPFAAAADQSDAAIAALAALARSEDDMSLLQRTPPSAPEGIQLKFSAEGVQMIAQAINAGGPPPPIEPLGDADSAAMIALAQLTRPGPFRARTHTMGRFIGVKENGRLLAMAGERMQPEGFTEVSGVCTHPDARGKGYAAALSRAVADRILAEGRTPFLHAYAANEPAIALYRKLGFTLRCMVTHAMWSR